LTNVVRNAVGINDGIDHDSTTYSVGQWTGVAHMTAIGAAAGVRAAGTRGAGREFSHWIPARWGGPRTIFNGNYVSPARHYYHDPFRYPAGWQDLGRKWNPILSQIDRIPNVYKGTLLGAGAGLASKHLNSQRP
jgi:hypothetical protein